MKRTFVFMGILFHWLWKFFTTGCSLVTNLVFLFAFVMLLSFFIEPEVEIQKGSALLLAPTGDLVEEKTVIDPISRFLNGFAGVSLPKETLLQDILDVIQAAADDERIKLIVLDLDELRQGGLNQLQTIGLALDAFKQSGKKIIATGDQFSQGQYYLASFADEIYLNPMGSVRIWGFGVFRLYMKELVDRLAVNFHVFKVGSFKSALEPFTRSSMSRDARASNQGWLNRVWDLFCQDIADNRGFAPGFLTGFVNEMPDYMERSGGNSAAMAEDNKLVDGLMTRGETEDYLISLVGRSVDGENFKQVHFLDYLNTIEPSFVNPPGEKPGIGIIVARGNIIYGDGAPGQIGSESTGALFRQARNDSTIKAVVLRIDSGGGSAFASEQIRRELLLLKKSGKPLVVSMGSLAASGAYWIAADADRIFASPFTLTGSIGIFGMIPTFENTLGKIGVRSDGVGTTKMAAAGDPTQPLPPELRDSIQLSVEEGYDRFLSIVAHGRQMEIDDVNNVAQGRVWDGAEAKEIGLVDELGGLDEAVEAAAKLAALPDYSAVYLQETMSSGSGFFGNFKWLSRNVLADFSTGLLTNPGFMKNIRKQLDILVLEGDPANIYAHSLIVPALFSF